MHVLPQIFFQDVTNQSDQYQWAHSLQRTCHLPQILAKKILVGIGQKLTKKIQKVDPPPYRPYRGGGHFEIRHFQDIVLLMTREIFRVDFYDISVENRQTKISCVTI